MSASASNISLLLAKYTSLCGYNLPVCISDVGLSDVSNNVVPDVIVPADKLPEPVTLLHCLHVASI